MVPNPHVFQACELVVNIGYVRGVRSHSGSKIITMQLVVLTFRQIIVSLKLGWLRQGE